MQTTIDCKSSTLQQISAEITNCQRDIIELLQRMHRKMKRLSEIVMQPCCQTPVDYINEMIISEMKDCKPGYEERNQQLLVVKQIMQDNLFSWEEAGDNNVAKGIWTKAKDGLKTAKSIFDAVLESSEEECNRLVQYIPRF